MKTENLRLFRQIAETGSLVHTADLLNLPKSNLSRRLQSLEAELGVKLFHRDNRQLSLTSKGEELYRSTTSIMIDLDRAIELLRSETTELSGRIRVQLLPLPQMVEIASIIFDFMAEHPSVNVEIVMSTEEKNLASDQIDVGFRVGRELDGQDFVARAIKSEGLACFASPQYLLKYGRPISVQDLAGHECVQLRMPNGRIYNEWPIGLDKVAKASGKLIMNSIQLMYEAVIQHRGIVYVPESTMKPLLEKGLVERLFPEHPAASHHGWLIHRRVSELTPTVRKFVDFLVEKTQSLD